MPSRGGQRGDAQRPATDAVPTPLSPVPRWERVAVAAALAYLAARLLFLATHVDPSLPPDEVTHAGFARYQAGALLLRADGEGSYALGLVSHRPWLNTWMLARWLALRPGELVSDLVWMRFANAAMAIATALAAWAFARRAGLEAGARVLAIVLLTNVPMWSFLAASASYDNLATLLATAAFALLARWIDTHRARDGLRLAATCAAGVLTKSALLPLAALLGAASLAARRAAAPRALLAALASPRSLGARGLALAGLAAGLVALAAALYGGNLVRYGVLEPAANQVLPLEAALENRIFRQEHVLRSFRAGAIDFRQAAREIEAIEHAGDRAGAMWMLRRALELRRGEGEPLVGRLRYAATWTALMAERVFGVMGHRALYKEGGLAATYGAVALAAFAALAARFRHLSLHLRIGALVALAYALVLMQLVNYPVYRATGLAVEAVQGRYLFPVLAPLLAALVAGARDALPVRARTPVAVAVAALFVLGDFPYFLLRAGPEWFGSP
ncbi:MAG: hypothetical protein R3E88_10015 [Myxococcota bacterium]